MGAIVSEEVKLGKVFPRETYMSPGHQPQQTTNPEDMSLGAQAKGSLLASPTFRKTSCPSHRMTVPGETGRGLEEGGAVWGAYTAGWHWPVVLTTWRAKVLRSTRVQDQCVLDTMVHTFHPRRQRQADSMSLMLVGSTQPVPGQAGYAWPLSSRQNKTSLSK